MNTPEPAVPYRTLPAAHLGDPTAPLRWLLTDLFLVGAAGILGGAPKSGKSFFALELAVAVASATAAAGRFAVPAPGPVLLCAADDPPAVVVQRLAALAAARAQPLAALPVEVIVEPGVRLPDGLDRLAATVARLTPRLLILDPLIRLHRADENSAAEMAVILDGLRTLARATACAILLVHHTRKAPAGGIAGHGLRGSSDLHAFGDTNLRTSRKGPLCRLRSHITENWRGQPLVSHEVIIQLIGGTSTKTGLKIRARLDKKPYPTGVKISRAELRHMRIKPASFHGDWNYTIHPVQTT